jgi:hypothetical protein
VSRYGSCILINDRAASRPEQLQYASVGAGDLSMANKATEEHMTFTQIRNIALAAVLVGCLSGSAHGQSAPTSSHGAQATPKAKANSGSTMNKNSGRTNNTKGRSSDCPPGMARTAAPDNTKGPCETLN